MMIFRFTWTRKLTAKLALVSGLLLASFGAAGQTTIHSNACSSATAGWTFTNGTTAQPIQQSTTYWLLEDADVIISEAFDVSTYTAGLTLTFDVGTYGSGTPDKPILVEYSTDNGSTWSTTTFTSATPSSSSYTSSGTFSIAASTATQFKLRFKKATTGGRQGVRLDNILFRGTAGAAIALADNGTQVSAANVTEGTSNHILHKFQLGVTTANATLTGVNCTTAGSYDAADITNLKVRYSADATLDAGDATLSTLSGPGAAGAKTFPSFTSQAISSGSTGYIFITADIANSSASGGNTISVNAVATGDLTFSSGTKSGSTTAGGTQTIVAATSPTISITGSVPAFGSQCTTSSTASSSYTVSAANLTGNLVLTSPLGFEIKTGAGAWDSYVVLVPSGGTVGPTTIDVRFSPSSDITYSGNIVHISTGATNQNVAVSGTGVVPVTPSVSITSNPAAVSGTTTICAGTSVTFTASTSNLGSGTASYQWKLNGGNISGQTASTYTTTGLANGNGITCEITVTGGCVTSTTATSNTIAMAVNALPATPSTPTAAANPACGSTTLNAMTAPGGATYYWQGTSASGTSTANNANAPYAVSSSGTYYVRSSQSGCWSASSASAAVTINTGVTIGTQPSNQSTTTGSNATFTVSASNATGYQWQVNTGSGWNNIASATSSSYTVTSATLGMNGYQYQVIVSGTAPCTAVTSSAATLSVTTGPCLSQASFSPIPSGWSATTITAGSEATFGGNTGELATVAIANPTSLTFDLRRTTNTTAKTLYVEVSTTTQGGTYTTVATYDHSNTGSGSTTTCTVDLSAYTAYATVYVKFRKASSTTSPWYLSNVALNCGAAAPEINLKGNNVSIANNDLTPSAADHTDFGATAVAGGTIVRTFTIENTGGTDLSLTGSSPYVAISGTNAADFSITAIPSTPVTGAGTTTFQVTFDPSATGVRTATLSIANDDSDENPYVFAIQGTGVNSNTSDIVTDATFAYTSNHAYTSYQATSIASTANSVGVMKFSIRDGGASASDADVLGTEMTAITFNVTNIANVRTAALFGGAGQTTMVNNTPTINVGAGTIAFTGLSGANVTASDNSTKDLVLRVSYNTTVTDNQQLQYTVASATANTSGSVFAAANAGGATSSVAGDINRIEVTATQLTFVQQPTNVTTGMDMSPSPTVAAVDANVNRDLDFTGTVSMTSTGTPAAQPSATATSGLATFNAVNHSAQATGRQLTASSPGLTNAVSGFFDITTFTYAAGDFRPLFATDLSYNGDWEYFNGSAWVAVPDAKAPQNTSVTINRVIINTYVTGGGSATKNYNCDFVIQSGGELALVQNDAPPVAAEFLAAGKKLEVLSGGILTVQGDIDVASTSNLIVRSGAWMVLDQNSLTNDHPMWDGVELFEGGSTVFLNDWDWTASAGTRSLINVSTAITSNANGYKFGNFVFDANPSSTWTMVGGPVGIINLCENDLEITNASANFIGGSTNATGTNGFVINGNMTIFDGPFSFGSTFNSGTFNHQFTVNGEFKCLSNDALKIHNSSGTAPTTLNGYVTFKGNVTVASTVTSFTNDATASATRMYVNFDGGTSAAPLFVNIAPTATAISMNVKSGAYVKLKENSLTTNSLASNTAVFKVETGGSLHFGWALDGTTPLVIRKAASGAAGTNQFLTQSNSTLYITSADGIQQASATTGNVQYTTGNKTFDQTATFWYVGKTNQVTGDAITTTSTGKVIVCELIDNATQLTLTNSTAVSNNTTVSATGGKLDIRKGQVIESTTAYITSSSGTLYMSPGTLYRIPKGNATSASSNSDLIPRMDGTSFSYNLLGGTVELAGSGSSEAFQTLRGSRTYQNVLFSGGNTYLTDYKNLSGTVTIDSTVELTGTSIVDCVNGSLASTSFVGNGGLKMRNTSRFRIKKLSTTSPELDGISVAYSLTGGTVEFYGTSATQNQVMRATDGSGIITYNHIDVNAAAANNEYGGNFYNVSPASSFAIAGNLNINSPAVFRFDASEHVSGSGNIIVNAGSTLLYGSANGIKTSGTGTSDGAVRVSGSRTFPTTASYGFIGNNDQVSGNGLPASMVNMYVDKGAAAATVTLTNSATVNTLLLMNLGHINTAANMLELGASTAQLGTLNYTTGYVLGKMRRWFNGTNSGNASSLFPMGYDESGYKNRHAKVEYTSAAAAAGHLTVQFIPTPMGTAGLVIPAASSGGFGSDVVTTENQGYWQIDNQAGTLTDGTYTISCTGEGFTTINSLGGITLLKRVGGGNWTCPGTHIAASGSTSLPTVSRSGVSGWSNFGFGGDAANPLPVQLTHFSAACNNGSVTANWTTASEKNSDYFILQRSENMENWEEVTTVQAAGNATHTQHYSANDLNPMRGVSYYRLVQVDFNGTNKFYNPVSVSCAGISEFLTVYPNPSGGDFTVAWNKENLQGKVELRLTTSTGALISERTMQASGGQNMVPFNEKLASGVYYITVKGEGSPETLKLVVR